MYVCVYESRCVCICVYISIGFSLQECKVFFVFFFKFFKETESHSLKMTLNALVILVHPASNYLLFY